MPSKANNSRLAPVLLQTAFLSEKQVAAAMECAVKNNQTLLTYILHHFAINPKELSQACAQYFGMTHKELLGIRHEDLPLHVTEQKFLQQHAVLPLKHENHELEVAISDPDHFHLLEEIQFDTGLYILPVMTPYDQLMQIFNQITSSRNYSNFTERNYDAHINPAVAFVDQILTDAILRQASDVHFEPLLDSYRVRMRIDGLLHEIIQAPAHLINAVTSRLKILAHCDISEKRLPQDGRFRFASQMDGQYRDCRLSTCPTLNGEKIVIRLLDSNKKLLILDELGLTETDQKLLCHALSQPQGLILVTGPTGSGKTITLYTALNFLNKITHNISTVEEPVEIQVPGINQVNIHEKAGLTFSSVLRALLRQDPDIIMVGEIRDKETAEIAIRAAQTGHLVLSTLHTNSAIDTLIRLINMGIASFNLANSLQLIIAQRLVRKLCPHCKLLQSNDIYQPKGCHSCLEGYHGREGIFELMPISKSIGELILADKKSEFFTQAESEGMKGLWQAGMYKVQAGITSLAEIYRVVNHE